jgi:hypothetical protein
VWVDGEQIVVESGAGEGRSGILHDAQRASQARGDAREGVSVTGRD